MPNNQIMLGPVKSRKRQLRSNLRLSLAKQQTEQQQRKESVKISLDNEHSVIPLPALQISEDSLDCSLEDSLCQHPSSFNVNELQLYAIPISSQTDHAWSNSAPEVSIPFEIHKQKTELDEQLDDILTSINNDNTPHSVTGSSLTSTGSATEIINRGSRRKDLPPSNSTDGLLSIWEQEKRRKAAHNDIEKRRREKIKDHIEELKTLVPLSYDIGDQPNSTSEILEATLRYIEKLKKKNQEMAELQSRVENLERTQRLLLLQKQMFQLKLNASQSAAAAESLVQSSDLPNLTAPAMSFDSAMEYSASDEIVLLDHNDIDADLADIDFLS